MKSRKFINFSITIFIVAGLLLFIGKKNWFPGFYNPDFMSAMSFIAVLIIILPSFLFKAENSNKQKVVVKIQNTLAATLILNGIGSLGGFKLYLIGFEYDKLVHFLVSFILFFGLVDFISDWKEISYKKAIIISIIIIFSIGVAWEILEFLFDFFFKTQTLGVYGKDTIKDTAFDLIYNTLGLLSATFLKFFRREKSDS
ncbi:DUF2238 domain-containing protein [Candidatus Wolfebacteria bacterium]|nr:DUF2238 domain-containing protein [Candidatus Wolfebacteria bacterium]